MNAHDEFRLTELQHIARVVAEDCATDTARREGQPFTGHNIAVALGEDNAKLAALAHVVAALIDELAPPVRCLVARCRATDRGTREQLAARGWRRHNDQWVCERHAD